jgi:hypothetical protein
MSDDQFAAYEAKYARASQLRAEVLPYNKGVLFDALSVVEIAVVTIDFDGYGDSASFDEPAAFSDENAEISIPTAEITIKTVVFDTGIVEEVRVTIPEFLEGLVSDLLEETHSGWEDGDGAYGQFHFSLAERAITLEYNERYVESHYHEHEF